MWLSGLGWWTEQALESVHADFKKFWMPRKMDMDHPAFGETLLKAICAYNGRHF